MFTIWNMFYQDLWLIFQVFKTIKEVSLIKLRWLFTVEMSLILIRTKHVQYIVHIQLRTLISFIENTQVVEWNSWHINEIFILHLMCCLLVIVLQCVWSLLVILNWLEWTTFVVWFRCYDWTLLFEKFTLYITFCLIMLRKH